MPFILSLNMVVVTVAAMTSLKASARKNPQTPKPKGGRISAKGIRRMTFLSSAKNVLIFA